MCIGRGVKRRNVGGREVVHERELEIGGEKNDEENDELKLEKEKGITECTGGSSRVEEKIEEIRGEGKGNCFKK